MQYEILYQPEFAVARIMLEAGEQIRAESGSMMSMSANIDLESKMAGGIGKALGRMVAGESMLQSTFTAEGGPGEVLLAPGMPGDIVAMDVSTGPMIVTSGSYLAGSIHLQMETIASLKGFISSSSLFMMRISGTGLLLVSSYGAIRPVELAPGQKYIVDTGHLVAFSASIQHNLRKAAKSLLGSVTSKEGIVAELTGPGIVYTQTRTIAALIGMMPARG